MAITNYTELQTSIGTWLHRSDLSGQIPDFIDLAEKRLNRRLRLLQMETVATPDLTIATNTVDLPSGFLEHIDLRYTADDFRPAQNNIRDLSSLTDDARGQPNHFAITNTYKFNRPADQTYNLTVTYYKGFDIATDITNWLLTNAPDVYLYGSLLEAGAYIKDQSRISTWSMGLDAAIKDLNKKDAKSRNQVITRVDNALNPSLNYNGGFDINRGY